MNNELLKAFTIQYTNVQKEPIMFFLLQAGLLALVSYDLELDCCLKKALHNGKACIKKAMIAFVIRMLGWASFEEMEVCLAQKAELETKVVQYEKYYSQMNDTFVETLIQAAMLEELCQEVEEDMKAEEEDPFYFVK